MKSGGTAAGYDWETVSILATTERTTEVRDCTYKGSAIGSVRTRNEDRLALSNKATKTEFGASILLDTAHLQEPIIKLFK